MKKYIENIDKINAYKYQIKAILDLMMCSEKQIDHESITTGAEMCLTLFDEMFDEFYKVLEDKEQDVE